MPGGKHCIASKREVTSMMKVVLLPMVPAEYGRRGIVCKREVINVDDESSVVADGVRRTWPKMQVQHRKLLPMKTKLSVRRGKEYVVQEVKKPYLSKKSLRGR